MKRTKKILLSIVALVITSVIFNSCVDKDYDEIVTANVDPNLTPTHTIAEFQTLVTGNTALRIDSDYVFAGVVAGDDLTGNIYKKLILQDSLAGISIQLDISNFNTEYPTGRRVFVKAKGLYLQKYDGNFMLGTSPQTSIEDMGRIPATLATKYLVKGMWGQYITPKVYLLSDQNIPTNTLVQFNNVEFDNFNYGVPWANGTTYNRTLKDCTDPIPYTLIVYSSSFATFAPSLIPGGKGSIVGVYTIYSGDGELQIRDTTDVSMTGLRCNQSVGNILPMSLDSIRLLDPGSSPAVFSLPQDRNIRLTITSDYTTGMLTGRNAYGQDSTAAIQLRFNSPPTSHTYAVGSILEINISNLELSQFAGVLQINNIPNSRVGLVGAGSAIPRVATIADIITNFDTWEGQLVKINGSTITGGGIYSGNNILNDGTGTIDLFTSSFATFANDPYPTGTVSVTGILTEYNGVKEILIRTTTDVQ